MMNKDDIKALILEQFAFQPTADQKKAIEHLSAFHISLKPKPVYILKGYAGTGKTSLVGAYINVIRKLNNKFVLLAPTGRAAKVLSYYTGFQAHTIHRFIYQIFTSSDGRYRLTLTENKLKNAVFLVDEASMINDGVQPDDALFSRRNLLEDLLSYVFQGNNNKLILVGDTAQLPPVGLDISPALIPDYLKSIVDTSAYAFEMKEVMRQSYDSGVLATATLLRERISEQLTSPPFFSSLNFKKDIIRIDSGYDLEELLQNLFSANEAGKGIIVCRTNKRANLFNSEVRNRILQRESRLEGGDILMIVKNNYFWLDESSRAGFIANGDMVRIVRIAKIEEMFGFTFADAEIELLDYPEEKEYTVKLLLDTIDSPGPGLPEPERNRLFKEVEQDYQHLRQKRKRNEAIQLDPYFNALHVKFAYAMTCHKTQGGQWPQVVVDQGYVNEKMLNVEYLRWLYTAITRSTDKIYLVNFKPEFIAD
jgi:exodeoxyribonuclease V